jgi:hypothetical protein
MSFQARACTALYIIAHETSAKPQVGIHYIIFGEKYYTNTGRNSNRYKIT